MFTVKKLIPQFLKGYISEEVGEYSTQEELLDIPFVKVWRDNGSNESETVDEYFHQYSLDGDVLVVEAFGGRTKTNIGKLSSTDGLNLPKWKPFNEEDSKRR